MEIVDDFRLNVRAIKLFSPWGEGQGHVIMVWYTAVGTEYPAKTGNSNVGKAVTKQHSTVCFFFFCKAPEML